MTERFIQTRHRTGVAGFQDGSRVDASHARWVRDDGYFMLLAVLFWLIFYQNLPSDLAGMASDAPFAAANSLDRVIKISMIVASGYLVTIRWKLVRTFVSFLNPGLVGFFFLAPLSMLWSIDPSATMLRFISLSSVLLVCFSFGLASWHPRRFQQVAIPPILVILIASLILGAFAPAMVKEAGVDIAQKDAWHGIAHSKNEFGMIASFGAILCANGWLARGRGARAAFYAAGTLASFGCVLLSRSNTSLFASVLAISSMYVMMRIPAARVRFLSMFASGIAGVLALYEMVIQDVIPGVNLLLAPIVGLTGKDTTFSARTVIWKVIKEHIKLNPYLGNGYGAYWVGPVQNSPSYIFLSVMYIYPTESHNGYLEVMNDLGIVGLLCLCVFLIWYVKQGLLLMRTDRSQGALYLALLFQEMVMDMSESDWFSRSDTFAVLALASVCLSRALLDARLRAGIG